MAVSLKNLDIPATMSLMQIYQTKLQPYEKAAAEATAAGLPAPELNLTEAESAQVKADLQKLLAAGPQFALENLSFNTANGESKANLVIDLTKPQSLDLPPDQLGKQLIALLDLNIQVSKPMLVDVLSVQGQLDGQTDAKTIVDQAKATADMFGAMAVGTQFATVDGTNVISKLHYANNEVEFNGQKMTVEQFIGFVMSKLGGVEVAGAACLAGTAGGRRQLAGPGAVGAVLHHHALAHQGLGDAPRQRSVVFNQQDFHRRGSASLMTWPLVASTSRLRRWRRALSR